MMKQVYGDQCNSCKLCYVWVKRFEGGRQQKTMTYGREGSQHHLTTLMLHTFMKSCVPIVDRQFGK